VNCPASASEPKAETTTATKPGRGDPARVLAGEGQADPQSGQLARSDRNEMPPRSARRPMTRAGARRNYGQGWRRRELSRLKRRGKARASAETKCLPDPPGGVRGANPRLPERLPRCVRQSRARTPRSIQHRTPAVAPVRHCQFLLLLVLLDGRPSPALRVRL